MRSSSHSINALTLLLLLGTMCSVAGCSLTLGTSTAATETAIVSHVCKAWVPITYSSKDTERTQAEAQANNAANAAFGCPRP